MATFITTVKFPSTLGLKCIDRMTKRGVGLEAAGKKDGVKITDIYWTLGDCDGVVIFEAPDEETAAEFLVDLGVTDDIRSTTLRAFRSSQL